MSEYDSCEFAETRGHWAFNICSLNHQNGSVFVFCKQTRSQSASSKRMGKAVRATAQAQRHFQTFPLTHADIATSRTIAISSLYTYTINSGIV